MAAGDVYRGVVLGHMGSIEWINTMFFKQLSASGDPGGLMAAIDSTIYAAMASGNSAQWSVDSITLSQLKVGGGEQFTYTSTTVGTSASAMGNGFACMVGSFRTALVGRSHRGRNYFPIDAQGVVTNGVIGTAEVTAYKNALNAFLAIYGAAGTNTDYTWGVWSRKLGETLDGAGHVTAYSFTAGFFPITAIKVDSTARVQRRRELAVGV